MFLREKTQKNDNMKTQMINRKGYREAGCVKRKGGVKMKIKEQ